MLSHIDRQNLCQQEPQKPKRLNQRQAVKWLREQGIITSTNTLRKLRIRGELRAIVCGDGDNSPIFYKPDELLEDLYKRSAVSAND